MQNVQVDTMETSQTPEKLRETSVGTAGVRLRFVCAAVRFSKTHGFNESLYYTFAYVLHAFINVTHKNRKDMKAEHEDSALNSHCSLAVNNDGIILETVTQRIFHSKPNPTHTCRKE